MFGSIHRDASLLTFYTARKEDLSGNFHEENLFEGDNGKLKILRRYRGHNGYSGR